jgi:hypothetical protein
MTDSSACAHNLAQLEQRTVGLSDTACDCLGEQTLPCFRAQPHPPRCLCERVCARACPRYHCTVQVVQGHLRTVGVMSDEEPAFGAGSTLSRGLRCGEGAVRAGAGD